VFRQGLPDILAHPLGESLRQLFVGPPRRSSVARRLRGRVDGGAESRQVRARRRDRTEVREEQRHRLPRIDRVEALLPGFDVDVGRRRRRDQIVPLTRTPAVSPT
jgi:hypothetical protein